MRYHNKKIKFNDIYDLSAKEIRVVEDALDLHARFAQGQFSHLAHVFWTNMLGRIDKRKINKVKSILEDAQIELHGDLDKYYKITSNYISRDAVDACRLGLILDGEKEEADKMQNYMGFNSIKDERSGECNGK